MKLEDLLKLLKSPEAQEALKGTKSEDKLKSLLSDIETSEDDDVASVTKKFNKRINELVTHFQSEMVEVKSSAVKEATQGSRDKEDAIIKEFTKNNLGMKDDKILALMQPLYDNGQPLAECYEIACRGMDYNPKTGVVFTDDERKAKDDPDEKKEDKDDVDDKTPKRNSLKSGVSDDDADDSDDEDEKEKKPKSLRDTLRATANKLDAKDPDLFKDDN